MPRTNYCTSNVNRRTDGRTDRRTDGQTDGRTEWGIAIALSQLVGWGLITLNASAEGASAIVYVFRNKCFLHNVYFYQNDIRTSASVALSDTRADETTVAYATVRPLRCTPDSVTLKITGPAENLLARHLMLNIRHYRNFPFRSCASFPENSRTLCERNS